MDAQPEDGGVSARFLSVPEDWQTVAPGRIEPDLCDHYGVCKPIIQRWRRESPVVRTVRGPDRHQRAGRDLRR